MVHKEEVSLAVIWIAGATYYRARASNLTYISSEKEAVNVAGVTPLSISLPTHTWSRYTVGKYGVTNVGHTMRPPWQNDSPTKN